MTFEAILGVAAFLVFFATVMFLALRQRQREIQPLMEAVKSGDPMSVRKGLLSGAMLLLGIIALIGYEEGVEGVITVFAVIAVLGGILFLVFFAARLWAGRKKRDVPSPGPGARYDNRLLFGGMLLAGAAFGVGTATLVEFHGATMIIIYYVVIPPLIGLILFVRWSYRRLRGKAGDDSRPGGEAEP